MIRSSASTARAWHELSGLCGTRHADAIPAADQEGMSATGPKQTFPPKVLNVEAARPHSQRIAGRYTCMALVPVFPPHVTAPPGRKMRPSITALPFSPWTPIGRSAS